MLEKNSVSYISKENSDARENFCIIKFQKEYSEINIENRFFADFHSSHTQKIDFFADFHSSHTQKVDFFRGCPRPKTQKFLNSCPSHTCEIPVITQISPHPLRTNLITLSLSSEYKRNMSSRPSTPNISNRLKTNAEIFTRPVTSGPRLSKSQTHTHKVLKSE